MALSSQQRALIACSGLALCFTGFSFRLVQLQVAMHDKLAQEALGNHRFKQPIYAQRGVIEDIHGLPLAQNEPVSDVVLDASIIKDHEMMARILAEPLQMSESELLEKMSEHWSEKRQKSVVSPWIVLKSKVREPVVTAVQKALEAEEERIQAEKKLNHKPHIRGVIFQPNSVRIYPNDELLCHVVGFVDRDGEGKDGIEMEMERDLAPRNGYRYIERDSAGRELVPYRGEEMPPADGKKVQLTIDSQIQMIVESELDEAMKQYKPQMAVSILVRPQTGEVLAMANRPSYNLNVQKGVTNDQRVNRAVMSMVEPGSTFKIVPTSAALALKLVNPETTIFCENGKFMYGGSTLHDHRPYGSLTIHDILMKSSNIGAAKLGIQLGDQKLYEYVHRFGFGEKTDIALPWEINGKVHPPSTWSKISITHIPMGQEVGVTPLQVVMAMSVIANGGSLMMPMIIHSVGDASDHAAPSFHPIEVRRVIPEKTAEVIRTALTDVVSKQGTAQKAHVDGFKVGGKTGTAQKAGAHGYEKGKYVVSFVGFMPAEHPEFVAIVMLDDPVAKPDQMYGGTIAAPIFAKIATRVAGYMNLPQTEPITAATTAAEGSDHEPD